MTIETIDTPSTTLYEINNAANNGVSRLIEARNQAQALRYLAKESFSITVPNAKRVAFLAGTMQIKIESALKEQA